jgi:hypothetical protein
MCCSSILIYPSLSQKKKESPGEEACIHDWHTYVPFWCMLMLYTNKYAFGYESFCNIARQPNPWIKLGLYWINVHPPPLSTVVFK